MKDFNFYTPTEVAFGKESEKQIGALAKKYGATKVLIHYGGKSAEESGLLAVVRQQLDNVAIPFVELGGVVPNPVLSKVNEGIALAKREGVDFILAVGGGSVIDSAKAIACGMAYSGDVWDFFLGTAKAEACYPIGVVLTIPAAGSEMSCGCVITKEDGDAKRAYDDNIMRPKFAVMNPERTYTLPAYQTACGATDIMMHTMERYFSHDDDMVLTDNIAEAILRTVKEYAPKVIANPEDYLMRSQIMWAGSVAHNDLTGCGTTGDWATHMLEHELSAIFKVAHGAGLAAIWPHWATYTMDENISRFARFAVNVMGVSNDFKSQKNTAIAGIDAMKAFYRSIGMPTSIPELIGRKATDDEIKTMAEKCSLGKSVAVGHLKELRYDDILAIYQLANR